MPPAAESLCRLGPDAQPAAVQLVRTCADTSEIVREWVVGALEEIGPPDPADLDELANLAATQDPDVAYWAITLLGRLGESAVLAVDALTRSLSTHPATSVRQRAAWALGKIGPTASDSLGALRSACAALSGPPDLHVEATRAVLERVETPRANWIAWAVVSRAKKPTEHHYATV